MLSNLWKVRQWTRNNENHWISCQSGTHPFLESSAALNLGPNCGLQITSLPHPLKEKKSKIFVSLWKRAQWSRKAAPAKSQMKEELHIQERPRQTIQEGINDGCSSMQGSSMVPCTSSCSQRLWQGAPGCHFPAGFRAICAGTRELARGRMDPVLLQTLHTAVMVI